MGGEQGFGDAEHLGFGFVGVGDEAVGEHGGGAGDVGEGGGDEAAGAAFGCREAQGFGLAEGDEGGGAHSGETKCRASMTSQARKPAMRSSPMTPYSSWRLSAQATG